MGTVIDDNLLQQDISKDCKKYTEKKVPMLKMWYKINKKTKF